MNILKLYRSTLSITFSLVAILIISGSVYSTEMAYGADTDGATGCVVGGSYISSSGGFVSSDIDLNTAEIDSSSGSIKLATGAAAVDLQELVLPFRQAVNMYFIYEGASQAGALGWYLVNLAEICMKGAFGSSYELPTEANPGTGITFREFYLAHQWCMNEPTIAQPLINWVFPAIDDYGGEGGVFDGQISNTIWSYDPDEVPNNPLGRSINFHEISHREASTEEEYAAMGMNVNNDGILNILDSMVKLPEFEAGTEIGFLYSLAVKDKYTFFSKPFWDHPSSATFRSAAILECPAADVPSLSCKMKDVLKNRSCASGNPSESVKINFNLEWEPLEDMTSNKCSRLKWLYNDADSWDINDPNRHDNIPLFTQGLITDSARDRLTDFYSLDFTGLSTEAILQKDTRYNHFISVAPPADKFRWIIGLENQPEGGDADFNDAIFLIEKISGGAVELKEESRISPSDPDAYITAVKLSVSDTMPCDGKTKIEYMLSINNGLDWVTIGKNDWNVVKNSSGNIVDDWEYGFPSKTTREVTINFLENGLVGRELRWKSLLSSRDDLCQPEIGYIDLGYSAAKNSEFSRSSVTLLSNVSYSATFETPAVDWIDRDLRGHLYSEELYKPENARADTGYDVSQNWDAAVSLNSQGPSVRKIITPKLNVFEYRDILARGDGTGTSFTNLQLTKDPIVHSSLVITDGVETFYDSGTYALTGSLGGEGRFNRYTGEIDQITFQTAPSANVEIVAIYSYYTSSSDMLNIDSTDINNETLGITDQIIFNSEGRHFVHDYNNDNAITEADSNWVKNWIRGYRNGSERNQSKEWLLAAVDHSTPALVGAPAIHSWYYGSSVESQIRDSFDLFMCQQRNRETKVYVGSKIGMIHSFNAGKFRPFHVNESLLPHSNQCSNLGLFKNSINAVVKADPLTNDNYPVYSPEPGVDIYINRGYYEWTGGEPDYGDGKESWAIIPNDQLPKLKNHLSHESDKSFVDASVSVAYVQFKDKSWHAVLITAEGNGGDTVLAIDITDPDDPKFLWEYGDPELFKSRSSPSMGTVGRISAGDSTGRWVVFFVSGVSLGADIYPSIYTLDIETGELVKKIYLDGESNGKGGTPSGQPVIIDSDGNGYVDKLFVGSDKGYIYKVILPDNPNRVGAIESCSQAFYNAGQPIYATPTVVVRDHNRGGNVITTPIVLFGTSDSPYHEDSLGNSENYKILSVAGHESTSSCEAGELLWEEELEDGHKVFASAFASASKIYFGTTVRETEDPCSSSNAAAGESGDILIIDIVNGPSGADGYKEVINNVGDIVSAPTVEDEHLYVKNIKGELTGYGGSNFQNSTQSGGSIVAIPGTWREINK
ncbi:MAG: PilC/PilY family type IV pilus protein [Nitrospinota bacterium]